LSISYNYSFVKWFDKIQSTQTFVDAICFPESNHYLHLLSFVALAGRIGANEFPDFD